MTAFFLLRNLLQQSRNQSITCRRFWFWWLLTTKRSDIFNYQGVETMATGYPSIHTKPTHSDQPNYTSLCVSVCVGEFVTRLVSLYRVSHEFMVSWTIKNVLMVAPGRMATYHTLQFSYKRTVKVVKSTHDDYTMPINNEIEMRLPMKWNVDDE